MSATIHPDDKFHVILDALAELSRAVESGSEPWEGYIGASAGDAKRSRSDYLRVVETAKIYAVEQLDDAVGERLSG